MAEYDPTEDLAKVAHELWRQRLLAQGWSHGPVYDKRRRTHDALVPYERLCCRDREELKLSIRALDLQNELADGVDYPRGPERPFAIEEMRPGIPVTYAEDIAVDENAPTAPPDRGVVESWETDAGTGELTCVRVRWADGSLSEHAPWAQELRRLQ